MEQCLGITKIKPKRKCHLLAPRSVKDRYARLMRRRAITLVLTNLCGEIALSPAARNGLT